MDPKKRRFGIKKNFDGPSPKVVGAPRTEFGTRLCQRVQCEKCEKIDYVPVKAGKNQFCRECAEKILMAYDQGRKIAERQVYRVCGKCHRDFMVNEVVAEKKDLLMCLDCLRGFEVWRGSVAENRRNRGTTRPVLMRLGSRTTIRKNIDDKL